MLVNRPEYHRAYRRAKEGSRLMQRRVAACQILTFPSPKASAEKIIHWMERAAAGGVEVVAFQPHIWSRPGQPAPVGTGALK